MTRQNFRFRNYTIRTDESSAPAYGARCAVEGDNPCTAASGDLGSVWEQEHWIAEHVRDTGHGRFVRTVSQYAKAEPGEWQ